MSLRRMTLCLLVICMAVPAFAQTNAGREKATATVKGKTITITYGTPSWGNEDRLAKATTGTVWRLGMNQATEIESTGDLVVGGTTLAAGKYSLWAKKTGDNTWVLAFHPKTGIWGAPPMKEGFVAETPLKMEAGAEHAEKLVISLADMKGKAGIKIHWGTAVLSGSFDVK
jgi:Protein of unknown function (DUF2911)